MLPEISRLGLLQQQDTQTDKDLIKFGVAHKKLLAKAMLLHSFMYIQNIVLTYSIVRAPVEAFYKVTACGLYPSDYGSFHGY